MKVYAVINQIRHFVLSGALLLGVCASLSAAESVDELSATYLSRWAGFYPTRAFAEGKRDAARHFEDYSADRLSQWQTFNAQTARTLAALDQPADPEQTVDRLVLQRQIDAELAHWRDDRPLQTQPEWYAAQVSQALTHVLVRKELPVAEKREALLARLSGISELCQLARQELSSGNRLRTESALRSLQASAHFFESALPTLAANWTGASEAGRVKAAVAEAAAAVRALGQFIEEDILPDAEPSPALGQERYAAHLARRSGGRLTPELLAQRALEEIGTVRRQLEDTAEIWWRSEHDGQTPPAEQSQLVALALSAMEHDRADREAEFVQDFTNLTAQAEQFVRDQQLATVPEPTTLYIARSPDHFAGAAVGGVYPSGPYAPNADTLFYLPSIPLDASPAVAEGFYRSFNHHFNTMIISHEMFPGHYLQYKVAVKHASPLRSVFADGAYVEGWGSFSEVLMLDAGWGGNEPLTWLAHYRKRLENATRSYLSVMVHTRDWDQQQVARFATERGLLAPQFAVNLWQRLVNSPLQLTDYFVGFQQFQSLWSKQREQAGEDFSPRALVDAVLRAGPVPVPELGALLPPATLSL